MSSSSADDLRQLWEKHFLNPDPSILPNVPGGQQARVCTDPVLRGHYAYDDFATEDHQVLPPSVRDPGLVIQPHADSLWKADRDPYSKAMTVEQYAQLLTRNGPASLLDVSDPEIQSLVLKGHRLSFGVDLCLYQPPTPFSADWTFSWDCDSVIFLSPCRIPLGSGQLNVRAT